MARIVIFDEIRFNAEMLAEPLIGAGHQVLIVAPPMPISSAIAFRPDLLFVTLYRRTFAQQRPIHSPIADLAGYEVLIRLDSRSDLGGVPRVLIGHSLEEEELPPGLDYLLYMACRVEPDLALPLVGRACLDLLVFEPSDAAPPAPAAPEACDPEAPRCDYTAVVIQWAPSGPSGAFT